MDGLLTNAESSHRLQSGQHSDKDAICPRCVNAQLVRVSLVAETGQSPNTLDTNSIIVLPCK